MIKIINEHFPGIFEFYFNRFINKQIINDFIPNGYLYFKDVNEIDIWGNDYIDYFNVKADEYYVCFPNKKEHLPYGVFERYVGYDSTKINNFLRSNLKSSENESILNQIEVLKHEMKNLKLRDNIVTIRKLKNIHIYTKDIQTGNIISDKGFLSTSLDLNYRLSYDGEHLPIDDETIMIIKIPSGQSAIYLEPISKRQEFELLLPNNVELFVEKKIKVLNNYILLVKVLMEGTKP